MKTATVTWITYRNYGTALQAYALQQYLLSQGIDNTILSDRNIVETTPLPKLSLAEYLRHPARGFFQCIYAWENWKRKRTRWAYARSQKLFARFHRRHLRILYGLTREDMPTLNDRFDAFLCGSDQIWSVLDYNFDGYFYLDFVSKKKISYAASIGTTQIPSDKQSKIAAYLEGFSAISLREQVSAGQVSQLLHRPVAWVADPTLLQTADFWQNFCKGCKTPRYSYLLCYFLTDRPWYFDYAKALAANLGLQPLLIPSKSSFAAHSWGWQKAVGPKEFVALFRDADFVLTDSYHGSIFAIQFKKKFLHLKRFTDDDPICQNIRVDSLFGRLGLEGLILPEKAFSPSDPVPIDYETVHSELENFRRTSRTFLCRALEDI